MNVIIEQWKLILGILIGVFLLWAFTPSCATKAGQKAKERAEAAIERAHVLEIEAYAAQAKDAAEVARRVALEAEVIRLDHERKALKSKFIALQQGIAPRPVTPLGPDGKPVPLGEEERQGWVKAVETRDAALAKAEEVMDVQETELEKQKEFISSLEKSVTTYQEVARKFKDRGDSLEVALAEKELQIQAMKAAGAKAKLQTFLLGVAIGFGGGMAVGR